MTDKTNHIANLQVKVHNFLSAIHTKEEKAMSATKHELIEAIHSIHPDKPKTVPMTPLEPTKPSA